MAKLLGHDVVTAAELEAFAQTVKTQLEERVASIEERYKNHKFYLIGVGVLLVIAITVHFLH